MGDYERYAVPHSLVNALRARLLGRAPLRLKPSRICDSMGDYVRYAMPYSLVNALRARLLGGPPAGLAHGEWGVWGAKRASVLPERCCGARMRRGVAEAPGGLKQDVEGRRVGPPAGVWGQRPRREGSPHP
jgi:hypothetical protein